MRKCPGRLAHATRSSGQHRFWDTEINTVYKGQFGTLTASEFFNKYGEKYPNSKLIRGEPVDLRYDRRICRRCGSKIELNGENIAICSNPECGEIYNMGGPMRPKIERMESEITEPPPKKVKRLPNSFWKAAKSGCPA